MTAAAALSPFILVIEDDAADALMVVEQLKRVGYDPERGDRIVSVGSLQAGIGAARRRAPDAALLDLGLPDSNGIDSLLGWLRAEPNVPTIVLSGTDEPSMVDAALQAGAQEYLIKGRFGETELAQAIGRAIARGAKARALIESESHYRTLFTDGQVAMLVLDPSDGRIVDANTQACSFYGHDVATLRSMKIGDIDELGGGPLLAEMAEATERRRRRFESRHRLANGDVRDVEVASGPIEVRGRTLLCSIVQDATERKRSESRTREAMVVYNASSQGIMTTDARGVIRSVNPAFCRITGYEPAEVIGRNSSMFQSGRHSEAFFRAMWESLAQTGTWEGEIWNRRRNGDVFPVWMTISAVHDADGNAIEHVALFSDITLRKQQEEAIWRQANFDALTGLANRALLNDRLERGLSQARRQGTKLGLLMIDLDGFKWINDTLGHNVGDEVLIEVAKRLKGSVRDRDTVARPGGDEFLIVVHDLVNVDDLHAIGEKIVRLLRKPIVLNGSSHAVSGSVGITVFPEDGDDAGALLRNADLAMYKSKQAGKNRCRFYAQQMQVDAQSRADREAELRTAIDTGAFVLHYQPIVHAGSGELHGFEALIRWQHPTRGLVAPHDFIPAAEDSGLIHAIGEWTLRESAAQWQRWQAAHASPLRLALNISGVQFRDAGLPELLTSVLEEHGMQRSNLMLEINETVLMQLNRAVGGRIGEIRSLGIGYSLDDFGTGFSSMSCLKRHPVDVVKIDRSFVHGCASQPNDARFVEAIVRMAHGFELLVVAEGVENEAQKDFLCSIGCDFLQGHFIGRPMVASRIDKLIRERAAPRGGAPLPQASAG